MEDRTHFIFGFTKTDFITSLVFILLFLAFFFTTYRRFLVMISILFEGFFSVSLINDIKQKHSMIWSYVPITSFFLPLNATSCPKLRSHSLCLTPRDYALINKHRTSVFHRQKTVKDRIEPPTLALHSERAINCAKQEWYFRRSILIHKA